MLAAAGRGRLAEARYVLPSFVERRRTDQGDEPVQQALEERIIFLGVQIDDASANDVIAQLITLESIDRIATSSSTSTRPAGP